MAEADHHRIRARATWSAGNWQRCSELIAPVGPVVLQRLNLSPGVRLLDVGTGSGSNIAIPAARIGADVVGLDVTPELLAMARDGASEAGVDVAWVEGDAQDLPFADGTFDRVTSTFGAMFAPDHRRAAGELVRVCRPGGRIAMTTWTDGGFVGELFALGGSFVEGAAADERSPSRWGVEAHVRDVFGAAGVQPDIAREIVEFQFTSIDDVVEVYATSFGPFVTARAALEPQGRWPEFLDAFRELVRRFSRADRAATLIPAEYLVIEITR